MRTMRMLRVGIIVLGAFFGGSRVMASAVMASSSLAAMFDAQEVCCTAVKHEEEMIASGRGGGGLIPAECEQYACPGLQVTPRNRSLDVIQEQLDLRTKPTCDASEWRGRCPSGSSMLLAQKGGGCLAAGCVEMVGGATDEDLDEDATLRAVVAEELDRLAVDYGGRPPPFGRHCTRLRKDFVKDQKKMLKELKKILKTGSLSHDAAEDVRVVVEAGTARGFQGAQLEEAKSALTRFDDQQKAAAFLRRLPGEILSKIAKTKVAIQKKMDAKDGANASLQGLVKRLVKMVDNSKKAAAADVQHFREVQQLYEGAMDAGEARELRLRNDMSDLDSTLREVREAAGTTERQLRAEVATAEGAKEDALAWVSDLVTRVEDMEASAIAERRRTDAAILALRKEAAGLQHVVDAAIDRADALQGWMEGEVAVAVARREQAEAGLSECAAFMTGLDASSTALEIAVVEAAGGEGSVGDMDAQERTPSGVWEASYLEKIYDNTRVRFERMKTTFFFSAVSTASQRRRCETGYDSLWWEVVELKDLLADQRQMTESAEDYAEDLRAEITQWEETDDESQAEIDACFSALAATQSRAADLHYLVADKASAAGAQAYMSIQPQLRTALDRYSNREDVWASYRKLRRRFIDMQRTINSVTKKLGEDLDACNEEARRVRRKETLEGSPESSSIALD